MAVTALGAGFGVGYKIDKFLFLPENLMRFSTIVTHDFYEVEGRLI